MYLPDRPSGGVVGSKRTTDDGDDGLPANPSTSPEGLPYVTSWSSWRSTRFVAPLSSTDLTSSTTAGASSCRPHPIKTLTRPRMRNQVPQRAYGRRNGRLAMTRLPRLRDDQEVQWATASQTVNARPRLP